MLCEKTNIIFREKGKITWLAEGVCDIIEEILGKSTRSPDDPDAIVKRIEIEQTYRSFEIEPISLRSMVIENSGDIDEIKEMLNDGEIAIVDISPMLENAPSELKKTVKYLKGFCNEIRGDLARVSESKLIITPKIARIEKENKK